MAVRWSASVRQGWRIVSKLSKGAPSRRVVPGSGSRTLPSEESGLRSVVVAGLVFCSTSGALCSEQLKGMNETDHVGEVTATKGSSVEIEEAPNTRTDDPDGNLENSTRIMSVSNVSSGARRPESVAKDSSAECPSSPGGCLNRFAIADAAARAAPAVVNLKVALGFKAALRAALGAALGLFGRKRGGKRNPGRQGFGPITSASTADEPIKQSNPRFVRSPFSILCLMMKACCTGRRNAVFGESTGSGFIYESDGSILTNAHVVSTVRRGPSKGSLTVTLQDGRNFDGEVINVDYLTDVALIKVTSSRPLPVVKFGTSKDLRPGEWVVALGSPLRLHNSVTAGIISCVDRKSAEIGLDGVKSAYIQTDAAINEGNSGGPLINLDGEVIGMNTMKALKADGVSFAIPIDSVVKVMEQLKSRGRVIRPWLGMKMWELTEPRILQLKEIRPDFPDVTAGVLVSQVIPGSPAFRSGVHNDDVIIEFDEVPVTSINQVLGDKVGISFKMVVKRRNNEEVELYVMAEEATPDL